MLVLYYRINRATSYWYDGLYDLQNLCGRNISINRSVCSWWWIVLAPRPWAFYHKVRITTPPSTNFRKFNFYWINQKLIFKYFQFSRITSICVNNQYHSNHLVNLILKRFHFISTHREFWPLPNCARPPVPYISNLQFFCILYHLIKTPSLIYLKFLKC